jgi:hypothetical protein
MQTPALPSPSRLRNFTHRRLHLASATGLFENRFVEVVRNLFLSSLLWLLLAVSVYAVYTMIVSH